MFLEMVKRDFLRKKIITVTVFIFITLATVFGASGMNIIANLIQSMSDLKVASSAADLAIMHSGELNQNKIDEFVKNHSGNILNQETVKLLNIEGLYVELEDQRNFATTIQDMGFVVQNEKFDFLLNLENEIIRMEDGKIGVPIYFMQEYKLNVGDELWIRKDQYEKKFIISDYVRDYEMSTSLTSSKRFLLSQKDYCELLENGVGEVEYLIQFQTKNKEDVAAIKQAYIDEKLPANGPTIEGSFFQILNGLSDALLSLMIMIISLLLILIASICIRLIFIATIEEDLREIGVMKALGMGRKVIQKVYLTKYRVLCIIAGVIGYALSFIVVGFFSSNIKLYFSTKLDGTMKYLLAMLAPIVVYGMIILYCKRVLKTIEKITAVEALKENHISKKSKTIDLNKNNYISLQYYIGLMDVKKRFYLYRLLIGIFIACTFLVILPLNIYNTMNSPKLLTYMGVGACDLRVDLRRSESISKDFEVVLETMEKDKEISRFAAYRTCAHQVLNRDGEWESIPVESGDHDVFPLEYLEGRQPQNKDEIALSYANAKSDALDKKVGDTVVIKIGDKKYSLTVTGIYQDITNGGKTAKVDQSFPFNEKTAQWYIIYLDLNKGVSLQKKMHEYQTSFQKIQINDAKEYATQTMGNMNQQLRLIFWASTVVAVSIAVLIITLFLKMMYAKDQTQIGIMRSLGVSIRKIKEQYQAGVLCSLFIGIVLGLILVETLGELLMGVGMGMMGASKIQFIIKGWQVFIAFPILFWIVTGISVQLSSKLSLQRDLSRELKG